jgi:hypothetical protein
MRGRLALVAIAVSVGLLVTGGLVQPVAAQSTVLPAPPKVFLDTSYTPPSGRTIAVSAGGDFQAALKAAQRSDVITLEPGAVYTGYLGLPNKAGTRWIVVRSGAPDDRLPAPGARVTPAFAPAMPKILRQSQDPAVYTESSAHHYRFIGIEVSTTADVKTSTRL